jgi:hypothetical protein
MSGPAIPRRKQSTKLTGDFSVRCVLLIFSRRIERSGGWYAAIRLPASVLASQTNALLVLKKLQT